MAGILRTCMQAAVMVSRMPLTSRALPLSSVWRCFPPATPEAASLADQKRKVSLSRTAQREIAFSGNVSSVLPFRVSTSFNPSIPISQKTDWVSPNSPAVERGEEAR